MADSAIDTAQVPQYVAAPAPMEPRKWRND